MKKHQKSSITLWIIIIAVILVGTGLHFYSQTKTSTTWQTYDAKPLPFTINIPKGDTFSAPQKYGDGAVMLDYRITNTPTELSGFRGIEIAKDNECPKGNSEIINDVTFIVRPDQGYFGGMESGSIDAFYCTVYNGSKYTLLFTVMYDRLNGKVPDQVQSMAEFDKEARLLNLKFNSPLPKVTEFSEADIHYGCYLGDVNQKKSGTPSNWVLIYSGTKSAQWCDPIKANNMVR